MFENLTLIEGLKLFAPIIILELGLKIFCITSIIKNGVRNLSKPIWIIITLFISTLGPIIFLIFGKRSSYYDQGK